MSASFLKGAAVGAVTAVVTTAATTALAGTGVGAAFNLGRTNSVSAQSTLTGHTKAALLKVDNGGTGNALSLLTRAGTPPLHVSSSKKVANFNADRLDGYSSGHFAARCPRTGGLVGDASVLSAGALPATLTPVPRLGGATAYNCSGKAVRVARTDVGSYVVEFRGTLVGASIVDVESSDCVAVGSDAYQVGTDSGPIPFPTVGFPIQTTDLAGAPKDCDFSIAAFSRADQ